jgi:methyl-accepting chemotaxis protein
VASASEEQSAAAEEISKNIDNILNVTKDSSEQVRKVVNSAEDLNKFTNQLKNLISVYKFSDLDLEKNKNYTMPIK